MIDSNGVVVTDVNKATIRFLSPEEIRKQSVVKVDKIDVWDILQNPVEGGLHDVRMGPVSSKPNQTCGTCGLGVDCPGHIGHIELSAPAYHPILLPHLIRLLKCVCFRCARLRMDSADAERFMWLFRLLAVENLADMQLFEMLTGPLVKDGKVAEGEVSQADEVKALRKKLMKDVKKRLAAVEAAYTSQHRDAITAHLLAQDLLEVGREASDLNKVPSVHPPIAGEKQCIPLDAMGAMSSTKVELWAELQKRFFTEAHKKKCQHCSYDHALGVRRSKDHTRIIVQWSPNQASPFGDDDAEYEEEEMNNAPSDMLAVPKANDIIDGRRKVRRKELFARDVEEVLHKVFETDKVILSAMIPALQRSGPGLFFMRAVAVPSNRFRPLQPAMMGDGRSTSISLLHPRTASLLNLLNASSKYDDVHAAEREASKRGTVATPQQIKKEKAEREKAVVDALTELQVAVNCYLDRQKAPNPETCAPGLRQLLERKQGLFRMKMMGKRVNYAARSVISPDPSINTNEIGMPIHFAMTLTFPEPVNNINLSWLQSLVIAGPDVYPGANAVRDSTGRRRALTHLNLEQRTKLAESLAPLTPAQIAAGLVQPIVYRHAKDDDSVLMNRQPTLHKPSIMSMRVRVLTGQRTIRMHYANCNTFNADFDGDEMNMHLPQDLLGRAEAAHILNADAQFAVPKDGSPLRGLIQDHCGAGAILTSRGTFLTRAQYEQLVFVGLHRFLDDNAKSANPLLSSTSATKLVVKAGVRRVHLETPALIKPKELFTGKQVMTTIIKSITETVAQEVLGLAPERSAAVGERCFQGLYYKGKSRVPGDAWLASEDGNSEEAQVVVYGGELLQGVLDKNQFGASANGIVHIAHEILGPRASGGLLSAFGRVFSEFFRLRGFTCAMSDLYLDEEGERQRELIIREIAMLGARNLGHFGAHFEPEESLMDGHAAHSGNAMIGDASNADRAKDASGLVKMTGKEIAARGPFIDRYVTEGVRKVFAARAQAPDAYIKLLDTLMKSVVSKRSSKGADLCKGSRMLRPFPLNGFATMVQTGAKGSKVNFGMICSFLSQQELEGKRVPMMASGKTLPSFAAYDLSARPGGFISDRYLTGLRPQEFFFHCMSGREGLVDTAVKTARSGYLQRCLIKGMEGVVTKYDGTVRDSDGLVVQFQFGEDGMDTIKCTTFDCLPQIVENFSTVAARHKSAIQSEHVHNNVAVALALEAGGKPDARRSVLPPRSHGKGSKRDPLSSTYIPAQVPGVVTEKFQKDLQAFIEKEIKAGRIRPDEEDSTSASSEEETGKKSKKSKTTAVATKVFDRRPTAKAFELLMRLKFQSALVDSGEAVGVTAGQSIGEPSTQMTLNTFHLAGHGAANVTLGIPRLRELLQTASENMGTPMATIAIRAGATKEIEAARAQEVCKTLRKVTLFELVESLKVHTRRVRYTETDEEFEEYEVEATMVDLNLIQKALPGLTPQRIVACLRSAFASEVLSKLYQQLIRVAARAELQGAKATLGEETNDEEAAAAKALSGALDSCSLRGVQMNKLIAGFRLQGTSRTRKQQEEEEDMMMEHDVKAAAPKKALDEEGNPLLALGAAAESDSDSSDSDSDSDSSEDEEAAAKKINAKLTKKSEDSDSDSDSSDSDSEEARKTKKKVRAANDDEEAGSDVERDDESEGEFDDEEKAVEQSDEESDDDVDVGDNADRRSAKKAKRTRSSAGAAGAQEGEDSLESLISRRIDIKSKSGRFLRSMDWDAKTRRFTLVMAHPRDKLVTKPVLIADTVRKIAMHLPVQSVKGLSAPQILQFTDLKKSATNSRSEVRVNGSNFKGLALLDPSLVDHSKITSNDVFSISKFWGIEAARTVFVREMASVFGHYGITVDYRHLYLIGDTMTRNGKFLPFNRMGMASQASPFLQMTYETSSKFLGECSLRAATDDLNTPAGAIVAGKMMRIGTGAFNVLAQVGTSGSKAAAEAVEAADETTTTTRKRSVISFRG